MGSVFDRKPAIELNSVEDIEAILDTASWIAEKAERITAPWPDVDYVEWDGFDECNRPSVRTIGRDADDHCYHCKSFPAEWLLLDDDSLAEAKYAEQARIEAKEQAVLKAAEDEKREKEFEEYLRLKAKFEKE